jgi:hydrogenase maturation factor
MYDQRNQHDCDRAFKHKLGHTIAQAKIAGFSQQGPGVAPRSVHVGFMLDKVNDTETGFSLSPSVHVGFVVDKVNGTRALSSESFQSMWDLWWTKTMELTEHFLWVLQSMWDLWWTKWMELTEHFLPVLQTTWDLWWTKSMEPEHYLRVLPVHVGFVVDKVNGADRAVSLSSPVHVGFVVDKVNWADRAFSPSPSDHVGFVLDKVNGTETRFPPRPSVFLYQYHSTAVQCLFIYHFGDGQWAWQRPNSAQIQFHPTATIK